MKQQNMSDCVAAVAAMATGTTLEQFKAEIVECPDGGYSEIDFIAYCARNGILAGGINYPLDEGIVQAAMEQGWVGVPLDQPAFVGVRSERLPGKEHAIYWDGKQVWDPNPDTLDGRSLLSYEITMWWPLARSSEGAEYLAKRFERRMKMDEKKEVPCCDQCPPMRELPRYRCHKEVWALKIKNVVRQDGPGDVRDSAGILVFEDDRYAPKRMPAEFIRNHEVEAGGYYVVYKDDYESFSPAQAFEEGYTLVE